MDLYLVISLPQTIIQPNNEKKNLNRGSSYNMLDQYSKTVRVI